MQLNKMPLERDGEFILEILHMKTYTPDQLRKMMDVIPEGTSCERFQAVLGSGLVQDIFHSGAKIVNRLAVRRALELGALPSELGSHIVDYGMSLDEMIAAGNYDWKNDDLNAKRFPIVGTGRVEFEDTIFHFDRYISSEDAVKEIIAADPKNPWEPGKIENILAYGAKNPEEQRKFPIVGLGSVGEVNGDRLVSCLNRNDSKRDLDLRWWGAGWNASYRFLGVRKKVSQTSAPAQA